MWDKYTNTKLILPLSDPNSEMRVLPGEAVLKYPNSMGEWAKYLTVPKPDLCFGSKLNRKRYNNQVYSGQPPSIFSLDYERVQSLFTTREYIEISCGAVGVQFVFPTFAVERQSDNGSCYFAQNQLIGTLRCMIEAQVVARRRLDQQLPVLAMGLVNVGNWMELWAVWLPLDTASTNVLFCWHIADYHLFNLRSCVEFSSVAIRINQWIRRYQTCVHDAIMNRQIPMDMPSPTIGKHHRSDEPGDNSGPESKRVAKDTSRSTNPPAPQGTSDNQSPQLEDSDSPTQDPCADATMDCRICCSEEEVGGNSTQLCRYLNVCL